MPANGSLVDVDVFGGTGDSMVGQSLIWTVREIRYRDRSLRVSPGALRSYRSQGTPRETALFIKGYAQTKLPPGKHALRIILDVGLSDSMNEEAGWSSERKNGGEGEAESAGEDDIGPRGGWLGVMGTWTMEVPVDLEIPDNAVDQEPQ